MQTNWTPEQVKALVNFHHTYAPSQPSAERVIIANDGRWFSVLMFDRDTPEGEAAYQSYKRSNKPTTTNIPPEVWAVQKQMFAEWQAYKGDDAEYSHTSVIHL